MSNQVPKWLEKLNNMRLPDTAYNKIFKEIKEFGNSGNSDSESFLRYIEFFLNLPWEENTFKKTDLSRAEKILNENVYGMEKLKSKLMDHIAVENHLGRGKGKVLLLHGPAGTGKTHIAECFAKATGKLFYPMRLGGLQDTLSILGTYRGYKNARSSYLMEFIANQHTKNIVVLLDEVDKLDNKSLGVQHALLQLTDNTTGFVDSYLDFPFDLSQVTFIATANTLDSICKPLLDRMQIFSVDSYGPDQLIEMMKGHLIPIKIREYDLDQVELTIEDNAVEAMRSWCAEGSVRALNHHLDDLLSQLIRRFNGEKSLTISRDDVLNIKLKQLPVEEVTSFDLLH